MVLHPCNPSIQEAGVGGSEVRLHPPHPNKRIEEEEEGREGGEEEGNHDNQQN